MSDSASQNSPNKKNAIHSRIFRTTSSPTSNFEKNNLLDLQKRLLNQPLQPILTFEKNDESNKTASTINISSQVEQRVNSAETSKANGTTNGLISKANSVSNQNQYLSGLKPNKNEIIKSIINKQSGDSSEEMDIFNPRKMTKGKSNAILIKKQAPSLLIIESLVWNICCLHETDNERRCRMYNHLCKSLSSFSVLGVSYKEKSLQPMREIISSIFDQEISQMLNLYIGKDSAFLPVSIQNSESFPRKVDEKDRYREEFEEIGEISRGGFGVVIKAKHRFDDCVYAVKKISFPIKSFDEYSQITREVKLYADLQPNSNVVAYKTAWIQNWTCETVSKRTFLQRERTSSKTYKDAHFYKEDSVQTQASHKSNLSDDYIQFEHSYSNLSTNSHNPEIKHSSKDDNVGFDCFNSNTHNKSDSSSNSTKTTNTSATHDDEEEDDSDCSEAGNTGDYSNNPSNQVALLHQADADDYLEMLKNSSSEPVINQRLRAVLYIQMELCGINLRQYLDERNSQIANKMKSSTETSSQKPFVHLDEKTEIYHFNQVLQGIKYIHSRGIIHRDLKPHNILFSLDRKLLKIGDFGLATLQHHQQEYSEHEQNNDPHSTLPVQIYTVSTHTTGLGTSIYAAPEQKTRLDYDKRVDIYSLGILLYEMFYPVVTEMERVHLIDDLKQRKLPESFLLHWPELGNLILNLTSENIGSRPDSIESVIKLFNEAFGEVEPSSYSSDEIRKILLKNQQLEKENEELRRRIKELEQTQ